MLLTNQKMNMSSILPTILIIEDDLLTLDLYIRELSRDFDVVACSDRDKALEMISSRDLDAVVLEPVILNGQGWDLFNDILALPPDVRPFPIILCSIQDERRRGLSMGASVFLVKPVLPIQLTETLHREIEKEDVARP
jgi:DNA-binding response OmpR family regulator